MKHSWDYWLHNTIDYTTLSSCGIDNPIDIVINLQISKLSIVCGTFGTTLLDNKLIWQLSHENSMFSVMSFFRCTVNFKI